MKMWKIVSVVVGFGLLLMLASCSKEVSSDDTKGFLSGLNTMFGEAYMNESSQILNDFIGKEPPMGPSSITSGPEVTLSEENMRSLRAPYGLDTLYGTWDYVVDSMKWVHTNPNNPPNAILFQWEYVDTGMESHNAQLRIDSLDFYRDSLPTEIWAGIKIDDDITWLAWLKFEATYVSLEQVSALSLIYEIVGYFQIGASISSPTVIDTVDFAGTVHFWAIDRTSHNYKVDLTITVNENKSINLVLEDSDGWKMDLDISTIVDTDIVEDVTYEKRNINGEITKNGNHAADISGFIWNPDDNGTHDSEVTIVFSDDTEGNFETYFPLISSIGGF
jgi:hypothetical protein